MVIDMIEDYFVYNSFGVILTTNRRMRSRIRHELMDAGINSFYSKKLPKNILILTLWGTVEAMIKYDFGSDDEIKRIKKAINYHFNRTSDGVKYLASLQKISGGRIKYPTKAQVVYSSAILERAGVNFVLRASEHILFIPAQESIPQISEDVEKVVMENIEEGSGHANEFTKKVGISEGEKIIVSRTLHKLTTGNILFEKDGSKTIEFLRDKIGGENVRAFLKWVGA